MINARTCPSGPIGDIKLAPSDDIDDGDVIPPSKKGKAPATGKGFGRQQTEDERREEDEAASGFRDIVIYGLEWRQPGWEPSSRDRQVVTMLKFAGYTDEDVARFMSMSVETLHKFFEWEIKHAKMAVIGDLTTRSVYRARKGNDILTMFLLKTRGGSSFSERANAVAALADSAASAEGGIDDKKRAELVGKILDLLSEKKKPKSEAKKGTKE